MEPACYTEPMPRPIAWYREFVPCKALHADVSAIFSFVPGSSSPPPYRSMRCEIPFHDPTFCSPQFADGHVSMLFELGHTCGVDGHWRCDAPPPRGSVTGPMSAVGRTKGSDRPDMIGVYFRPGRAAAFLRVPMSDLTDRTVAIDDVWKTNGVRLAEELSDLDEAGRINRLESYLLAIPVRRITADGFNRHTGRDRAHPAASWPSDDRGNGRRRRRVTATFLAPVSRSPRDLAETVLPAGTISFRSGARPCSRKG